MVDARLGPMPAAQEASWHVLFELYEKLGATWTLVGGQMVHLHAVERNFDSVRPTDDADAVLNVRERPTILFDFTEALYDLGFRPAEVTPDGHQHRWERGDTQIDVLIPSNVGERAAKRKGYSGSTTLETPAGTQALNRSQAVEVAVGDRIGYIWRPSSAGALVCKAAAHTIGDDSDPGRHREDFAVLAAMLTATDARGADLTKTDLKYLRPMIAAVRDDPAAVAAATGGAAGLTRLDRLIGPAG